MSSLQKGLVGHWTMDDRDVDNGKIRDRSAYDHDGNIIGASTSSNSIIGNTSADYTGSNSDRIEFPDGSIPSGTEPRTTAAWFKVANDGRRQMIFGVANGSDGTAWEMEVDGPYNGGIKSVGIHTWSTWTRGENGILDGKFNQWNHFAATWDGQENGSTIKLYLNGEKINIGPTDLDKTLNTDTNTVASGSSPAHGNSQNWVNGQVDDIRVYDRVLSESEIRQLYNNRTSTDFNIVKGRVKAEVYDTQYGHPSNKSELDEFFDASNSGVDFDTKTTHNRPHIFWGNIGQSSSPFGTVNDYPPYVSTSSDRDGYSWKLEGTFTAPESGTYTFGVDSDDASDVLINKNKIASFYGGHGFSGDITDHTGTVSLNKDTNYIFTARMEEGSGGDGIVVGWKKPSDSSFSLFPLEILIDENFNS